MARSQADNRIASGRRRLKDDVCKAVAIDTYVRFGRSHLLAIRARGKAIGLEEARAERLELGCGDSRGFSSPVAQTKNVMGSCVPRHADMENRPTNTNDTGV